MKRKREIFCEFICSRLVYMYIKKIMNIFIIKIVFTFSSLDVTYVKVWQLLIYINFPVLY